MTLAQQINPFDPVEEEQSYRQAQLTSLYFELRRRIVFLQKQMDKQMAYDTLHRDIAEYYHFEYLCDRATRLRDVMKKVQARLTPGSFGTTFE